MLPPASHADDGADSGADDAADDADPPSSTSSQHDLPDPLDATRFRGVSVFRSKASSAVATGAGVSSPPPSRPAPLFTATARWKRRRVVVGTAHPTAAAAAAARDRALFALAGREALLVGGGPRAAVRRGPNRLNFPAAGYPEGENRLRGGRELEAFLQSLRVGATPARGGPAFASRRVQRCGACKTCVNPQLKRKCLRNDGGVGGGGAGGAGSASARPTSPAAATAATATKGKTAPSPAAAARRRDLDRRPAAAATGAAQAPLRLSASKVARRELELRAEAAATAALLSAERGAGGGGLAAAAAAGGDANGSDSDSFCRYHSSRGPLSTPQEMQQQQQQLVSPSFRGGETSGGGRTNTSTSFDFRAFLQNAADKSGRFSFIALPRSGGHAPRRCALCREVGAHAAAGGRGRRGRCPMRAFLEEAGEEGRGGGSGGGGGESGDAPVAAAAAPYPSLPEAIAALAAAVRASENSGSSTSKRRRV